MFSIFRGQAGQIAKECNRIASEQRRNRTTLCASHNAMQVIPPTIHVTNLIAMVTNLIVETRRRPSDSQCFIRISTKERMCRYVTASYHLTTIVIGLSIVVVKLYLSTGKFLHYKMLLFQRPISNKQRM